MEVASIDREGRIISAAYLSPAPEKVDDTEQIVPEDVHSEPEIIPDINVVPLPIRFPADFWETAEERADELSDAMTRKINEEIDRLNGDGTFTPTDDLVDRDLMWPLKVDEAKLKDWNGLFGAIDSERDRVGRPNLD